MKKIILIFILLLSLNLSQPICSVYQKMAPTGPSPTVITVNVFVPLSGSCIMNLYTDNTFTTIYQTLTFNSQYTINPINIETFSSDYGGGVAVVNGYQYCTNDVRNGWFFADATGAPGMCVGWGNDPSTQQNVILQQQYFTTIVSGNQLDVYDLNTTIVGNVNNGQLIHTQSSQPSTLLTSNILGILGSSVSYNYNGVNANTGTFEVIAQSYGLGFVESGNNPSIYENDILFNTLTDVNGYTHCGFMSVNPNEVQSSLYANCSTCALKSTVYKIDEGYTLNSDICNTLLSSNSVNITIPSVFIINFNFPIPIAPATIPIIYISTSQVVAGSVSILEQEINGWCYLTINGTSSSVPNSAINALYSTSDIISSNVVPYSLIGDGSSNLFIGYITNPIIVAHQCNTIFFDFIGTEITIISIPSPQITKIDPIYPAGILYQNSFVQGADVIGSSDWWWGVPIYGFLWYIGVGILFWLIFFSIWFCCGCDVVYCSCCKCLCCRKCNAWKYQRWLDEQEMLRKDWEEDKLYKKKMMKMKKMEEKKKLEMEVIEVDITESDNDVEKGEVRPLRKNNVENFTENYNENLETDTGNETYNESLTYKRKEPPVKVLNTETTVITEEEEEPITTTVIETKEVPVKKITTTTRRIS
jgi:hypothetical protein